MTEHLFTLICEFDGGTYVSQVHAYDEQQALVAWSEVLRSERPIGDHADRIAGEALDGGSNLTALKGLSGVWCWTGTVDERLILTNIVRSA